MDYIFPIIGFFLGIVFSIACMRSTYDGTLYLDYSDPENDIYKIDLTTIDPLHKRKSIHVKIGQKDE